jgi:hypothetical protein
VNEWGVVLTHLIDALPNTIITLLVAGVVIVVIVGFAKHGIGFFKHGFSQKVKVDALTLEDVKRTADEIATGHLEHMKNWMLKVDAIFLDKGMITAFQREELDQTVNWKKR